MTVNRVIIIVLDSMGVGEMPDAAHWGDAGSNTLGNLAKAVGGVRLPHLGSLGLGNVTPVEGVPAQRAKGAFGRMAELSYGKDTTTGHWEMAGIILDKEEAFPTYPQGFPGELIAEFEARIGRKTLGNEAASGTEIIQRLGDEHVRTGYPIVYTSADSVFQIAAHEEVVPLEELYRYCEIAREMLTGPHRVGRVIARPFVGGNGKYTRTANRHDYAIAPFRPLIFNVLQDQGLEVAAVGKIKDIYHGEGITRHEPSKGNDEGVEKTLRLMKEVPKGLIMTNLVDYDMLYGHRNDAEGYARALEAFDARLPGILSAMGPEDVLMITADHGCDPTTPSTDHSREYVPVLICGHAIKEHVDVGTRRSFADLGATVLDLLGAPSLGVGESMAGLIRKG